MALFDTHCHLQASAFDGDRDEVLMRSLAELEGIVLIGEDLDSSRQAVAMVRERVFAAVGAHPYHAEQVDAPLLAEFRQLAARPGVVAIGEIGLDYHYGEGSPAVQKAACEAQLDLAIELKLPVVIHSRDADEDMTSILDAYHECPVGGVMHCFGSGPAFAEKSVAWGFHVSFAGNVTFPKAQELRDAAAVVPLERLLVETDSPYLAPQRVRGKRCEPGFVCHTAEVLADLKGVDLETFARQTTENAQNLFMIA